MAIMCSLAVCKAQVGMCGHEKAMLSVAVLAAIGFGRLLPDQLTGGLRFNRRAASQDAQKGRPSKAAGELGDWRRTLWGTLRMTGELRTTLAGHFQHPALAAVDHRQLARPFRFLLDA